MKSPVVAVLMGSDSDLPLIQSGLDTLKKFDVPFKVMVNSAHRSPESVREFALKARREGFKVLIAAAGGAAHLAGMLAAHTTLPVIGIPVPTDMMGGLDSLLSTVQMPGGIPVAAVAAGKSGPVNAAVLAVQILALHDEALAEKLEQYKKALADGVKEKNARLEKQS